MAIDTREKRQAVAGLTLYAMPSSPTVNAAPDLEWRQEVGWGYPGIAASTGSIIVGPVNPTGIRMWVNGVPNFTFTTRLKMWINGARQ